MFCGVLRCFVCVFLAFFTKQTKTDQKYTKRTKRTKCALCNTVQYGAVRLSLTQKMSTKNIRKTRSKHCKTPAKHRKTLFFKKHSQNTTKHPQNTRKTPQNTAKHHKTDLLTKQTKLANKPLRSPPGQREAEAARGLRASGGAAAPPESSRWLLETSRFDSKFQVLAVFFQVTGLGVPPNWCLVVWWFLCCVCCASDLCFVLQYGIWGLGTQLLILKDFWSRVPPGYMLQGRGHKLIEFGAQTY